MSVITAEKIYQEIIRMPVPERERLFSIIARHGFEKDVYRHKEVFDDIRKTPFTLHEAAEYLGVAEITLRRWIKEGKLAHKKIGKNIAFDADELKAYKKHKRSFSNTKS